MKPKFVLSNSLIPRISFFFIPKVNFLVLYLLLQIFFSGQTQSHKIFKRYVLHGRRWERCVLNWSFRDPYKLFASEHEFNLAKEVIARTIKTWEVETKGLLKFIDKSPNFAKTRRFAGPFSRKMFHVDIDIFFAHFAHGDAESFDGAGGMVAHTAYPAHGLVHFDASEKWKVSATLADQNGAMSAAKVGKSDGYVDLRYVALHEFGHALGLRHSNHNKSVMNPYYSENTIGPLHLSRDDVLGLEELYEHCKNSADNKELITK